MEVIAPFPQQSPTRAQLSKYLHDDHNGCLRFLSKIWGKVVCARNWYVTSRQLLARLCAVKAA
eukprot:1518317-Amphidinium_carterae.1